MESDEAGKVIKYILKASPYGETNEVLKDLTTVLKGASAEDIGAAIYMKEHNEAHLTLLQYPDEKLSIVLSPYNWNEDHYIDQNNKRKVIVDQVKQQIVSHEPIQEEETVTLETGKNIGMPLMVQLLNIYNSTMLMVPQAIQ